jgi:hypothetical protein
MYTDSIAHCADVRKPSGYSPRLINEEGSPPSPDNTALPGPTSAVEEFLAGDRL